MDFTIARKRRGLTQEQMAKKVGVTQSTIALWESGKTAPGVKRLKKVADAYGVSVDDILGVGTSEATEGKINASN